MKGVELYGRVRYAVQIEGLSHREAARRFGIDPRTVARMMKFSAPPGYVRKKPPARPKLDPLVPVIDRILLDDKSRPKKQQHTAKRIFERLRDEFCFAGGLTIVKDYVAGWNQRAQEMFVPLKHPPGHAQVDFGEAIGVIGGVERKIHFFAFDLPHSDACFVVGYPAETTEAFCDGHVRAFTFFGGVPQSILYDNTRPCRVPETTPASLRRLREGPDECLFAVAGSLSAQRLLGPDDVRSPRRARARLRP